MVVSRAIIVEPAAFNPTNPAIIILVCGDSGSSSMATEFTLSGSTLAALQVTTVLVHCLTYSVIKQWHLTGKWDYLSRPTFVKLYNCISYGLVGPFRCI